MASTVRPLYSIERVPSHTITEQVATLEPTGEKKPNGKPVMEYKGFVTRERVVKNGYMVYFPRGHSLFVESDEQLARLKLDLDGGLVDMATGERVDPNATPVDLKQVVARATQQRPRAGGGVEGNIAATE